ncbi:hypothetical protein [Fulvimonas yonginensis]|uniref:Uncharacterized protein n=1 Tax=Fulvimonas yonginensis TaxID=1495200 RepID=A0ABU8JA26_9GAMM
MIEPARIRWPRPGELTAPASVAAHLVHTSAEAMAARLAMKWWRSLIYIPGRGWAVLEDGVWAFRDAERVAIAIALQEDDGGDVALARRLATMPAWAPRAERRAAHKALRAWARKSPALPLVLVALVEAEQLLAWEPRA